MRLHRAVAEALEGRRLLTITVNTLADVTSGSMISLRQAIADSLPGGTINFSVTGTINLLLGPVVINKNLTIDGPGASELTINGGGHSTVINNAYGNTATLSDLTITGGNDLNGLYGGGGVSNQGNLTISNSVITGNTALLGGGIYSGINYTGGGIAFLTVVNSTISGNQAVTSANDLLAGKGGGIFANYSTASVSNSTLTGNTAIGAGGGSAIFGAASNPTITDSTISGNTALGGGGAIQGHQATVIQSTVANNSPYGILEDGGGATIAQSTIVGNDYGIEGSVATLSNSIIAGNAKGDIDGTLNPSDCHNNLIGTPSGGLTNGANGNRVGIADPGIELNNANQPVLANRGGLTQTVLVYDSSPAVNHGDASLIPDDLTTDQNGAPRVNSDGNVDIGATEVQGTVVASTVVNTTADEVAANSTTSLREAIGFAEQSAPATITFDPTVFSTPQSIQLALGELKVYGTSGAITIDGPGASLVEIDGQHLSADFETFGVATISGLTIANGSGSQAGVSGGIQNVNGMLTISNSVVTNNSTGGDGGGVNNDGGSLTITNSTISDNQSTEGGGGGVASVVGGSVSISDSTISNNTYVGVSTGSGLTLTNTIIAGNTPVDFGGDSLNANSTNNLIGSSAPFAGGLVNGSNGNIVGVANV